MAEKDDSGLPPKWQFVDESVAARAQRRQRRLVQQADEAEAAAKLAAQQERANAEKVVLTQTVPEHGVDGGVQFDVTLESGRRTRSNKKKTPDNSSPLRASSSKLPGVKPRAGEHPV